MKKDAKSYIPIYKKYKIEKNVKIYYKQYIRNVKDRI